MGDTPLRRDIFTLVQLETFRGWNGGGRRYGNIIVRQNADYSGGVFLITRYRFGKISINGELLDRDGVSYVELKGKRWYICSLNVPIVSRSRENAANIWVWVQNVDGRSYYT